MEQSDNTTDYNSIYPDLHRTLSEQSNKPEKLNEGLAEFLSEHGPRERITDDEYHWIMVYVAFYSGMKASIVTKRLSVIAKYLRGL